MLEWHDVCEHKQTFHLSVSLCFYHKHIIYGLSSLIFPLIRFHCEMFWGDTIQMQRGNRSDTVTVSVLKPRERPVSSRTMINTGADDVGCYPEGLQPAPPTSSAASSMSESFSEEIFISSFSSWIIKQKNVQRSHDFTKAARSEQMVH